MFKVIACITDSHDPHLVVLAFFICLFGSYTALNLFARSIEQSVSHRQGWVVAAGLVTGLTVWATHFVGILAFHDDLQIFTYDIALTLLSIFVSVGLSWVAFALMPKRTIVAGLVLGIGISAMHYIGMVALRAPARLIWNPHYIYASIAIAIVGSILALSIDARRRDVPHRVAATVLLVLAVTGLHFTGMTAITIVLNPAVPEGRGIVGPDWVGIAVVAVMIVIVLLGLVGAGLDQHLAKRNKRERDQLRAHIVALEAAQQELKLSATHLERALTAANAASEAKTNFLANMSHELRTPLNAIIGFTELIEQGVAKTGWKESYLEYLSDVSASGRHLLDLINAVLDMAKIETGQIDLNLGPVDLCELVETSVKLMASIARTGGVALTTEIPGECPKIDGDFLRLKQVVLNILSNAVKFTASGGKVEVHVGFTDTHGVITVTDTGCGISKADMKRIMLPFVQVGNSLSRKFEGSGLGLSISQALCLLHGGTLDIISVAGKGTTAAISLPRHSQTPKPD